MHSKMVLELKKKTTMTKKQNGYMPGAKGNYKQMEKIISEQNSYA